MQFFLIYTRISKPACGYIGEIKTDSQSHILCVTSDSADMVFASAFDYFSVLSLISTLPNLWLSHFSAKEREYVQRITSRDDSVTARIAKAAVSRIVFVFVMLLRQFLPLKFICSRDRIFL